MTGLTHEFSVKLRASPETVFAALTDSDALRIWFAEHVEIEPRIGGAYRFWGKHTYGVPGPDEAGQTLTAFEPNNRLAFKWAFDGVDSEVDLGVAPITMDDGEAGVELKGRHHFAAPLKIGRAQELVDDLWKIHCGNLMCHVQGVDGVTLPDFADKKPRVRASVLVHAPREMVWKALMTPEHLTKWMWAENPAVEPRVGGKYSYGWNYTCAGANVEGGPTKILDMVENEKLVTDWPDWRGDKTMPVQRVTWLLSEEDGKTRVTVLHEGFTRTADISDYPFGWLEFLNNLKALCEEQ